MAKTFKAGDNVLAKWPGSRKFEKATIVSITDGKNGQVFKVQYPDKTFHNVTSTQLKAEGKSPRKQSVSPKKPNRSRSASKSPARTPKERSVSRSRKGSRTPSQSPSRTKAGKSPKRVRSRSRSTSKSKPPASRSRSRSPSKAKPKATAARSRSRSPSKPTPKPKPKATKTPPRTPSPNKRGRPVTKKDEPIFSSPESSPTLVKKQATKVNKKPATPGSPARKKRQTKEQLSSASLIGGKLGMIPVLSKLADMHSLDKEVEEVKVVEKEQVDSVNRKVYSTRSKMAGRLQGVDSVPVTPKLKAGLFGILFSTLSILIFPTLTIYLALNSIRKNYSLLTFPQIPKASAYFNPKVAGVYVGFLVFQAVLNALPLGRIVRGFHTTHDRPRLQYRLNGIYSLIITVSLLGLLCYLGQPVHYIRDNFFKLTCMATAFSFIFSLALYIKSLRRPLSQISQFADTGCTPYDFHHGHELHPRIGALYDLKLVTLRTGLVSWAVVVISLTYKCYELNGCVHYELALAAGAQLLYILDLLYREEVMLATATVMHEGLGFGLSHASFAMAPFTFTVPVYFLIYQKPNLPLYCLAGMAALFLFALFMNRKSLTTKMSVKRSPDSATIPAANKIVAVPHEKVLVASGFWKLVRHPNYISEAIMFLAWTLPCGVQTLFPYLPAIVVFLSLLRRCFQVEAIMARNYQDAYQQYKHRVPKRLFPYVF